MKIYLHIIFNTLTGNRKYDARMFLLLFAAAFMLTSCDFDDEQVNIYNDINLVPNPKTADANSFVSNPDGILSDETVRSLNTQLSELENETTAEVAVVAVNSIGLNDIDDFANKLFNHWGIGKAGKDNGVLVLLVVHQSAIRFEIGYGLEGALPDAICKRIQTQVMLPEFRNEKYDAGILAGVDLVARIIKEEPVPELVDVFNSRSFVIWLAGMWVLFGLLPFLLMRRSIKNEFQSESKKFGRFFNYHESNCRRYGSVKTNRFRTLFFSLIVMVPLLIYLLIGNGLLFWQFLALLFASLIGVMMPVYGWATWKMKKIRRSPIPCTNCGGTMQMLSVAKSKHNLSESQLLEKKLKSMVYDVFECRMCQQKKVLPVKLTSVESFMYTICSKCGTKSVVSKYKTIKNPTYTDTGIMGQTNTCLFCQHKETQQTTMKRLSKYSSTGGSGGRYSGSGGGSFGGGSSGGGGSSSRW